MAGLNAPRSHPVRWDGEVCILQAMSRAKLIEKAAALEAGLEKTGSIELRDLAFTLNTAPPLPNASRLAIVAASPRELSARLAEAVSKLADPACRRIRDARGIYFFSEPAGEQGKIAFLFPGEGAQYPSMLADVCMHFPEARAWFDVMDRAFFDHERGYLPSDVVFPQERDHQVDARLWNMDGAVETVFAANQALLTLLNGLGVRPDMIVGHSSGDYSALLAANCWKLAGEEALIRFVRALNSVYEEFAAGGGIPRASLLAVGSVNRDVIRRILDERAGELVVALDNCPQQIVLCGTEAGIGQAEQQLQGEGAVTERLLFARPYHTPLFSAFSGRLRAFLDRIDYATPTADVYSCASASPYPSDALEFRDLVVEQWTRPVRFRETIEAMYEAGARIFVEVGPRGNLTGFVENTLRGRPSVAVAMNTLQRSGLAQLNHAAGLLAAQGVAINFAYLYLHRAVRSVALDHSGGHERAGSSTSIPLSLRLPSLRLAEPHVVAAARASIAGSDDSLVKKHDARARAMQEYLKLMERFLQVQRDIMKGALAKGRAGSAERPRPLTGARGKLPFLDRVVPVDPGRAAAICELNLKEHRFLCDHTLGGRVSDFDPDLMGLPVLPLAVSIEMLAEAASVVCPRLVAVGARNIRAHRWVALESERLTLRFTASVCASPGEVHVAMHQDGEEGEPLAEGTILFADRYRAAESAGEFPLRNAGPSKWITGEMYGRTGMFHGPAFQLVERMDRSGEDGAEATLVGRAFEGWLSSNPAPALLLDPMVLDAMGQIVGYWVGDRFQTGLSVFPVKLERLEVFAQLPPGARARCRVRVTQVDEDWIHSDIDTIGGDSAVMVRMRQWEDRRLELPARLYNFRIAPHEVLLSDEWTEGPGPSRMGTSKACRLRLPRAVLEAHGGIWLRVLAHQVLGREERGEWHRLSTASMERRLEWLADRIAAKDAVRLSLKPRLGLLRPADIEIVADADGRVLARGPWLRAGALPPQVIIAHSDGDALATAMDAEKVRPVSV